MKKDVDNIDIYKDSAIVLEKNAPNGIISWITILIIILVLFIFSCFIPFNIYKPYYGIANKSNDGINIILKLEYSDFPISKYNKLYIKNKSYNYEIINIENNNLILKIDLDNDLNINNNMLIVNILEDRTTLKTIILRKLKKGFGL